MARFASQIAKHLTNGDVRAVHEHGTNGRSQRSDGFEQADARFTIEPRIDHHQIEILETTLADRTRCIYCGTDVDAFLLCEVGHHRVMARVEIDDEQPNGCVHRCSVVAITPPSSARLYKTNQLHTPALDAFLLTGGPPTPRPTRLSTVVETGACMSTARLVATIRREFQDHPGIVVTLPQAQSRWSLDETHCTRAFARLMAEGFLTRIGDAYLWRDAPVPQFRIAERTSAYH